jgi:hypothetical protein
MKRSFCRLAVPLTLVCAVTPSLSMAQRASRRASSTEKSVSLGVGAGVSVPSGDLSDCCSSGFNAGGFVQWRPPNQVFGLRGDVQYHRLNIKEEFLAQEGADPGTTGNLAIWNFGVDGVMEVAPRTNAVGWYLLAGVGMYSGTTSVSESGVNVSLNDQSKVGFNAGGGLRFPVGGAKLFAEARWHTYKVDNATYSFIPITFGISW